MISAPLVLVMGSDHIITVDPHAYQIQGAIVTCNDFYKSLLFHREQRQESSGDSWKAATVGDLHD